MAIFLKRKTAFTILELLLTACIMFSLIGIFIAYANATLEVVKEITLRNELGHIRMALEHYRIVNSEYPQELKDLIREYLPDKQTVNIITSQAYLKAFRVSDKGELLDPYRNEYLYNSQWGRVWSSTKGFEAW